MLYTVQQARDYLDWQCQIGRGSCGLQLDRRGLGDLKSEKVLLGIPPDGETYNDEEKTVYLTAKF